MVTAGAVRFEHHRDALGIGESSPRVSWKTVADPGWRQHGYELEVTTGGGIRSSGRVESPDSVLVPWPDEP